MSLFVSKWRPWLIHWMYAMAAVHFLVGVLMVVASSLDNFASYHHAVLSGFWVNEPPGEALSLHIWWLQLFGATLQSFAIFMGAVIYLGNRQRNSWAWGWAVLALVIWAPQDICISLGRGVWMHVWIDISMLILMLPALIFLWFCDHKKA